MTKSWEPVDRTTVVGLLDDPARAAAAEAVQMQVQAGMTVGLGSGRALWATMELLGRRDELAGLYVVASSVVTERLAKQYGFNVVALDGVVRPDVCIDGADEVAPDLGLMKGRGAALLREKLVAAASYRFVVIAEAQKRVIRLGQQQHLPVEVVRFGWADTRRRLRDVFDDVSLRTADNGAPVITDEAHVLLDVAMPGDVTPATVVSELDATPGVVEHGLFLDFADEVLLGHADGAVEALQRPHAAESDAPRSSREPHRPALTDVENPAVRRPNV